MAKLTIGSLSQLGNVDTPSVDTDAANKAYVDSKGTGNSIYQGTTMPADTLGKDGDLYEQVDSSNVIVGQWYRLNPSPATGKWVQQPSARAGNATFQGTTTPADTLGVDGDIYEQLDSTSSSIIATWYRLNPSPATNKWVQYPSAGSNVITLQGTTDPTDTQGSDGWIYQQFDSNNVLIATWYRLNPSPSTGKWKKLFTGALITSPNSTITVGGNSTSPTVDLAQQNASTGQSLKWNGTKWAPADDTLGTVILQGTGTPADTLGKDGDLYEQVNVSNALVATWYRLSPSPATNKWVQYPSNTGSGNVLQGTDPPSDSLGQDGDLYQQLDAATPTRVLVQWYRLNPSPSTGKWISWSDETIVNNTDGTITVSNAGYTYTVKLAQNGATANQVLVWDSTSSKWLPKTVTVTNSATRNNNAISVQGSTAVNLPIINDVAIASTGNTIDINVNGVISTTTNIVNSNSVTYDNTTGAFKTTVNGVDSQGITIGTINTIQSPKSTIGIRTDLGGGIVGLDVAQQGATQSQALAWDNTAGKWVPRSVTGVGGLVDANIIEPSWRSVSKEITSDNVINLTVTDNSQPANKVFAGLNEFAITLAPPSGVMPLNQIVAQGSGNSISIIADSGLPLGFAIGTFPVVANTHLNDGLTGLLAALAPRWSVTYTSSSGNIVTARFSYNGTTSPFVNYPTTTPFLSIQLNGNWTNIQSFTNWVTTTNPGYAVANTSSGAPQFRLPNPDDLTTMIPGTAPTTGQVPAWDSGKNAAVWVDAESSVTTVTGTTNNISVVDSGTAPNHAYTVDLVNTAVTPGSYDFASITVDAKGRLTAASTGTPTISVQDEGTLIAKTNTVNLAGEGVAVFGSAAGVNITIPGTQLGGTYTDNIVAGNGLTSSVSSQTLDGTLNVALGAQDGGADISGTYYKINLGNNLIGSVANGILTINATGGGGAGAQAAAFWGPNYTSMSKAAYSSPSTPNTQGVRIQFTASTNVGQITAATVSFGGTNATGTYSSTGTFPNYSFDIPSSAVPAAAQTASNSNVVITGTYDGVQTIFQGGTLTTQQPIAATQPTLSVTVSNPAPESVFFPAGTGTVQATAIPAAGTTLSGVMYTLTPSGGSPVTNSTGTFTDVALGTPSVAISAGTVSGAEGGAVNVPITTPAQTPAVSQSTFTPAYWTQTANSTKPTLDISSANANQTSGDPTGQTITISNGTLSTNYVWLFTTSAASKVFFVTPFGNTPATADVTYTTTTTNPAKTFNIFGFTGLNPNGSSKFVITA